MIKNILWIIPLLLFALACDDGDIEFERINFDNANVGSCVNDTTATFLYKVQGKSALILKLPQDVLVNEEGTISGVIPTNYQLLFRSFNENVNRNYFCSDLPPSQPSVVSEISATGGTVEIKTVATETNGRTKYNHLITITDLVLVNSQGEKLIDSKFDFGTYVTEKE